MNGMMHASRIAVLATILPLMSFVAAQSRRARGGSTSTRPAARHRGLQLRSARRRAARVARQPGGERRHAADRQLPLRGRRCQRPRDLRARLRPGVCRVGDDGGVEEDAADVPGLAAVSGARGKGGHRAEEAGPRTATYDEVWRHAIDPADPFIDRSTPGTAAGHRDRDSTASRRRRSTCCCLATAIRPPSARKFRTQARRLSPTRSSRSSRSSRGATTSTSGGSVRPSAQSGVASPSRRHLSPHAGRRGLRRVRRPSATS